MNELFQEALSLKSRLGKKNKIPACEITPDGSAIDLSQVPAVLQLMLENLEQSKNQIEHAHQEWLAALDRAQILLEARILTVADVVEAMSSHRPYRPGLGIEAALAEIIKQRGIHFDPVVVDACLAIFREQHYSFSLGKQGAGNLMG